jgi:hypothetical protein
MKNVLKIVGVVLGLVIVGVLGAASMQPDSYHVERSATYAAAPGDVFPYVNDLEKWNTWNPFMKNDPNVKNALAKLDRAATLHKDGKHVDSMREANEALGMLGAKK